VREEREEEIESVDIESLRGLRAFAVKYFFATDFEEVGSWSLGVGRWQLTTCN
jgi:hypothetical protein